MLKIAAMWFLRVLAGFGAGLLALFLVMCGNVEAQGVSNVMIIDKEFSTHHMKCATVSTDIHLNRYIFTTASAEDMSYANIDICRKEMLKKKKKYEARFAERPIASILHNQMLCSYILTQGAPPQIQVVIFEKQPSDFDTTLQSCLGNLFRVITEELPKQMRLVPV